MKRIAWLLPALLWLGGAEGAPRSGDAAAIDTLLHGRYDNRAQVAGTPAGAEDRVPQVTVAVDATPIEHFALWHVHLRTDPQSAYDQTWAMQTRIGDDASGELIPYYQLHQDATPQASAFDPEGWLSLEACALRGTFTPTHVEALSEGEPCVAVSMNVGARRALLPVALTAGGDKLRLYLNLRGVRTLIDLRRTAKPSR